MLRLLVAFALSILAVPLVAGAHQVGKISVVGVLNSVTGPQFTTVDTTRKGLRGLGYVEGRNIVVEGWFAEQRLNHVPELATELVPLDEEEQFAGVQLSPAA